MKISIVSNLFCALALTLSLTSFAADKKKTYEDKAAVKAGAFDAALYKVNRTNKVKLSVDKGGDETLKIVLKDKGGNVFYSEVFNDASKYRRVFDLDGMVDGVYTFELLHNKKKLVKEVMIQSTNEKVISLQ